MSSFARLATVTASTKRATMTSGKRGAPTTNVATLACTPLDPVDPEIRQRLVLDTPGELLQTFVDNAVDIVQGDTLVVGSKEYPIKAVADWTWRATTYRWLIVEDLKR
jgi:hypothetical protein